VSIFGKLKTNSGPYTEANMFPKCDPYIRLISISIVKNKKYIPKIIKKM